MKYYLNFIQSIGLVEIDEPFGTDKVPFAIVQESGRKGRDVQYSGGSEASYRITKAADRHGFYFDQFLKDWQRYGFELQIELLVDFGNGIQTVGNVAKVRTNEYDTIDFIVVQKLAEARLKRNYDVTQDLFAEPNPVNTELILVPAKPLTQTSTWKAAAQKIYVAAIAQKIQQPFGTPLITVSNTGTNTSSRQVDYGINDSLSFISYQTVLDANGLPTVSNFTYLQAEDNYKNLKIKLSNIDFKAQSILQDNIITPSITSASGFTRLIIRKGFTPETSELYVLHTKLFGEETSDTYSFPTNFEITFPLLKRNEYIYIYFENKVDVDFTDTNVFAQYFIRNSLFNMDVSITGSRFSLNTVVPCIRYIDAINKVVADASGLGVTAPRFEFGGEFYNQYITNATLMRNIEDKPFYLSFKDIVEEHIRPEPNGDYEIDNSSKVFIGIYEDFYRDVEIGNFEQYQYEDYNVEDDEAKSIKIIKSGFKTYQSQKETETGNTFDIVHGDMQHKTQNENAVGTREAMIGFIRDAFTIVEMQKKANDITRTAATQDDRKVVMLDVVPLTSIITYTETFELQHIWDPEAQTIVLRNAQLFNWLNLGIAIGGQFQILNTLNAGVYTVLDITEYEIFLSSNGGNNIIEDTTFKYYISPEVRLKMRTNEGFDVIQNLADGENYGNLRFTSKRVLEKYFSKEIASYCLPTDSEVINTEYNNNPEALTQISGEPTIIEGETFKPKGAILEPKIIKCKLAMTLSEYWDMASKIRSERGYIRTWDAQGMPIKGYVKSGEFIPPQFPTERQGYFDCVLEKKYEEFYMEIFAVGETFIINGTEQPSSIGFSIDSTGYLSIYDSTGKLLFYPVPFDRVKLNNSGKAQSPEQLGLWLSQFS